VAQLIFSPVSLTLYFADQARLRPRIKAASIPLSRICLERFGLGSARASWRAAIELWGGPPYPPRTMVEVKRLFDDDIVEIDSVFYSPVKK
jgi:hypothetical protein